MEDTVLFDETNPCERFPYGSRLREICEGRSELSIEKANKLRALYGITEIPGTFTAVADTATGGRSAVSVSLANAGTSRPNGGGCKSCGKASRKPQIHKLDGRGPGSALLKSIEDSGSRISDGIFDVAKKMDTWGRDSCKKAIKQIASMLAVAVKAEGHENEKWIADSRTQNLELSIESHLLSIFDSEKKPISRILAKSKRPHDIEPVVLEKPTRHVTFHVWPVKEFGAWQWNCDRLISNSSIFNGRRIVSIVYDEQSDDPDEVMKYLDGFTNEFIVTKNDPKKRETKTFLTMLDRLKQYDSTDDITFSCHAKCVKHKTKSTNNGTTIFKWTQAMWETCTRMDIVEPILEKYATAGSFRRLKKGGTLSGFGPWHYSGTFFWWRNKDVFARKWDNVPNLFFGTEAWPGILFDKSESGVILGDNVGNLYEFDYWSSEIEPMLMKWRLENAFS